MARMKCCICGEKDIGYGNNAQPLKSGQCCDDCNKTKVIPKRLEKVGAVKWNHIILG